LDTQVTEERIRLFLTLGSAVKPTMTDTNSVPTRHIQGKGV